MSDFKYTEGRFADIQMLRYRLEGFDKLSLRRKKLVYCLSQAALFGRDITFDQFGKYNLKIRKTLEAVYTGYEGDRLSDDFKALEVYLKRVWFSNGIYHHYGCDKFVPGFSEEFFTAAVKSVDPALLPLNGMSVDGLCAELCPVMLNPDVLPVKVCKKADVDIVESSACNFYDGVTQDEVEGYYASVKDPADDEDYRSIEKASSSLRSDCYIPERRSHLALYGEDRNDDEGTEDEECEECREPPDGPARCLRAEDAVYRDVDLVHEEDAREYE